MKNLKEKIIGIIGTTLTATKTDSRGSEVKTYFYLLNPIGVYGTIEQIKKEIESSNAENCTVEFKVCKYQGDDFDTIVVSSPFPLHTYLNDMLDEEEGEECDNNPWEDEEEEDDDNENTSFEDDLNNSAIPAISMEGFEDVSVALSLEEIDGMMVGTSATSFTLQVLTKRNPITGEDSDPAQWLSLLRYNKGLGADQFSNIDLAKAERQRLLDNPLLGIEKVRIYQTISTHVD